MNNEIEIIGDSDFCNKTKKALQLLKDRDIDAFNVVIKYVGVIKQHSFSGMDVFQSHPTFLVGSLTSNSDSFWYASCILHDATHSLLYFHAENNGRDGVEAYQGYEAEMYCLTKQIETLKKLGAPRETIEYATSLYDSKWYEISEKKRHW